MTIENVDQLEDAHSTTDPDVKAALAALPGDIVVLGAGGKMGPSLARMAKRASDEAGTVRRVIAVSRFTKPDVAERLQAWGVETIACDLLDRAQVDALPDAPNVVYMTGMKFGTSGNEGRTWAMNTYAPALACERYRDARFMAFSTGNVYGMADAAGKGSSEEDPTAPDGEYAMSCLGRERVFDYFSRANGTPVTLVRLNYACELRYGVLVDLANWVWKGRPVPLAVGYLNAIWQRDANAIALRSLANAASPPYILNLTGPEKLVIREVAQAFGRLMNKEVRFEDSEMERAYLSDASRMVQCYGPPRTPIEEVIERIADWVMRGGQQLDLPTHFEVTSGKY